MNTKLMILAMTLASSSVFADEHFIDATATIGSVNALQKTVTLNYTRPCGGGFVKAFTELELVGQTLAGHSSEYKVLIAALIRNNPNLPCVGSQPAQITVPISLLPVGSQLVGAEILNTR